MEFKLYQMDVKSAFLNGYLKEEVYVMQPLCLKSVGLGFDSVPFHSGWELVVWEPNLSEFDLLVGDLMEICGGSVENETLDVCGPQIELSVENPTDLGEPPVEVPGAVPTVVVDPPSQSHLQGNPQSEDHLLLFPEQA